MTKDFIFTLVCRAGSPCGRRRAQGFTLLELLVALALGLLLMLGLVTLFSATSKTNRVQDGLARLQEGGRYGFMRMESDMRMLGGQFRTTQSSLNWVQTTNGPRFTPSSPWVNSNAWTDFPDANPETTGGPGSAPAGQVYALSPRNFVQGYECESGACTPALPTTISGGGTPLPGSDALTLRYQRGTGWKYRVTGTGETSQFELLPGTGDDPLNFEANDLALLSDCNGATIFNAQIAGNVVSVTTGSLRDADQLAPSAGGCDPCIFNFTKDFVTATYWLRQEDIEGRANGVLVRNENGTPQEIVQGVERLDFLFGIEQPGGLVAYLTAAEIDAVGPAAWLAIRSIEVHALFNTVSEIRDLVGPDMAYRYSIDGTTEPAPPAGATMPVSALPAGQMMRREFISFIAVRNGNS